MNKILLTVLFLSCTPLLQAKTIDLECEVLANKMITKLVDEGLLLSAEQYQIRAREISAALCGEVQDKAEVQHQKAQASALQNWAFENRPDKPGNKRLKKFK